MGPGAFVSFGLAAASALASVGALVAWRVAEVVRRSRGEAAEPADAVLVLGRSLANDQPTPVFEARLRRGFELWQQGVAPRMIIAGGLTGKSTRTEAVAGRELLLRWGVPPEAVHCEDKSRHTLENLFNVRQALTEHGWSRLVIVSDPLHLARVAAYADGFRLDHRLAPAHEAPPRRGSLGWWLRATKEAYFLHWYHVGLLYSRAIRSERLLKRVT